MGDDSSGRVLDDLESLKKLVGNTGENGVAGFRIFSKHESNQVDVLLQS